MASQIRTSETSSPKQKRQTEAQLARAIKAITDVCGPVAIEIIYEPNGTTRIVSGHRENELARPQYRKMKL